MISVIIPTYNPDENLKICVKSILEGNTSEIEIILVDDCSPNSVCELYNFLTEKYKEITVIKNAENAGVSKSRANGFRMAKGDFVFFADQDDVVKPGILDVYFRYIRDDKYDIVTGVNISVWSQDIDRYEWEKIDESLHEYIITNREYQFSDMRDNGWNMLNTTGKLYTRSIIEKTKIMDFEESFPTHFFEDGFFPERWFCVMEKMLLLDIPVYIHRETGANLGGTLLNEKYVYGQARVALYMLEYIKTNLGEAEYAYRIGNTVLAIQKAWYVAYINKRKKLQDEFVDKFNEIYFEIKGKKSYEALSALLFRISRHVWRVLVGNMWFDYKKGPWVKKIIKR